MSDLFELDEAFAALTRDVSAHAPARGAGTAIRSARHRRRTAVGAVVAVAAIAVGGITMAQLGGDSTRTDVAHDPLPPAPALLDAAALSSATEGWTGPWQASEGATDDLPAMSCFESLERSELMNLEPSRSGTALFAAPDGATAFVISSQFTDKPVGSIYQELAGALETCAGQGPDTRSWGVDRRALHVGGEFSGQVSDVWLAQLDDRLSIAYLVDVPAHADRSTAQRVSEALVAALQVDATFTQDGLPESTETEVSSEEFSPPTIETLTAASGSWDVWDASGTGTAPACLPSDWTAGATEGAGGGGSFGGPAEYEYVVFGDAAAAEAARDQVGRALQGCPESWTLQVTATGGLYAWSSEATVFVAVSGPSAMVLWVDGASEPPRAAAEGVLDLLADALG